MNRNLRGGLLEDLRNKLSRPSYARSMKRAAAFLSYYVGLALSLAAAFSVARDAEAWQFLFIPLYALPIWWIAAGIGIRLGVYPSEFFRRLATAAGFIEPLPNATDLRERH